MFSKIAAKIAPESAELRQSKKILQFNDFNQLFQFQTSSWWHAQRGNHNPIRARTRQ